MAGYSKTSQAKKLNITPGSSVGLGHAPAGWALTDPPDDTVRAHALEVGIVDVKVVSIDDDWSGPRYVWRRENRGRALQR
jgi:hypothetical protein